jgi:hypothetical protein
MNTRRLLRKLFLSLTLTVLMGGTLGCQEELAGPRAWIDFPLDGSSVPVGAPVSVISHAYAREGVAEVLLLVNGEAYRRSPPAQPGQSFSKATQEWFPQNEGTFTLRVRTYSQNGESGESKSVNIRALGKGTPAPTRVTPSPVGMPDLAIVSVQGVVVGYKGPASDVPICDTRVIYRNTGTAAVPREFTIQFHFNGVPTLVQIAYPHLAPGASAEMTFVYRWAGLPYIGINLDSTNVIAESDETNNAFAEIRLCAGTPPPTTVTPTLTRTPIILPPPITLIVPSHTPTRTPTTPAPPPTCSGTPSIASFYAYPTTIAAGQSSTLTWGAVTNADSVSIEPGIGGVATPGSTTVTPNTTTTYTLTARCGNNTATRQAIVTVTSAPPITSTFTPTPDTQGPPAPNQVSPSGTLSCRSSVTLDWNAVSDPSGIKTYYVKLERQVTPGNWQSAGGWTTSSTAQSASVQCGGIYRWQVRAEDNAGNDGPWSGFMNFSINLQ